MQITSVVIFIVYYVVMLYGITGTETLTTDGMYAYVRHPMYLLHICYLWLVPNMTVSHLIFSLCATTYIILGSNHEEHRLITKFGNVYKEYKRNVTWIPAALHWAEDDEIDEKSNRKMNEDQGRGKLTQKYPTLTNFGTILLVTESIIVLGTILGVLTFVL